MKPLFTGFYCPNDCDKPELKLKKAQEKIAVAQDALAKPNWTFSVPAVMPYRGAVPGSIVLPNDVCRDFYCGGKGKIAYTIASANSWSDVYMCQTCSKTWSIKHGSVSSSNQKIPAANSVGGIVN